MDTSDYIKCEGVKPTFLFPVLKKSPYENQNCFKQMLHNISVLEVAGTRQRRSYATHWTTQILPNNNKKIENKMVRGRLICSSSGLAKTTLEGTVEGSRRRGRQRKRWEDNIREWTGLKLSEALRKTQDRDGWRKLNAKPMVLPLRSSRLREARWETCLYDVCQFCDKITPQSQGSAAIKLSIKKNSDIAKTIAKLIQYLKSTTYKI